MNDKTAIAAIMRFLNPETDEEKLQVKEMLAEIFGDASFLAGKELAAITKEEVREIIKELRQQVIAGMSGAKHKLSGFASGPGGSEGGPRSRGAAEIVSKERTNQVRDIVLVAMEKGRNTARLTSTLKATWTDPGTAQFFRLEYEGAGCPRGFTREGMLGQSSGQALAVAECQTLSQVILLAKEVLALKTKLQPVSKETIDGVRTRIVAAIAAGDSSLQITPQIKVTLIGTPLEFFRVSWAGRSLPPGFTKQAAASVSETTVLDRAMAAIEQCLGHEMANLVSQELAAKHPLSGMHGSQERATYAGYDVR